MASGILANDFNAQDLADWGLETPGWEEPLDDGKEFDETCADDVEMIECPQCKHKRRNKTPYRAKRT